MAGPSNRPSRRGASRRHKPRRPSTSAPAPGGVTVAREAVGRERVLLEHDSVPLPVNAALDALARHRAAGEPLDRVVSAVNRERRLGPRERTIAADLTFSWARHQLAVEKLLKAVSREEGGVAPRRRLLDLAGICLAAVAAGIDVDDRWTHGLPPFLKNAVDDAVANGFEARASLPPWLERRLNAELGAAAPAVFTALASPAPVDLAVDTRHTSVATVQAALAELGVVTEPLPRAAAGLRVKKGRLSLPRLPLALRQAVWPMDEGSQLVGEAVGARPGERVLDMCAGGGGKSRILLRAGAEVVAADVDARRLSRSAPAGVVAVAADGLASPFRKGSFDRVLVDSPCSGTGTLRRAPDLALRLDPASLPELVERQRALLRAAITLARPGGVVVYATCSLLREENDGVVDAVCAEHPGLRRVQGPIDGVLLPPASDGFYVATVLVPETGA